jgi:thiamine transporter
MSNAKTAIMSEGALCVALSTALSWLVVFRMPQGGSITFELVPLVVFAWRRGLRWGSAAGALNGALQIMLGGYVVHPLQALLDYPAAYAVIGLAGLWTNWRKKSAGLLAGLTIGGLAQFACHVGSGVAFFSSYVPQGMNPWIYSILYNSAFLAPKLIISMAASWFLWKRLEEIKGNVN